MSSILVISNRSILSQNQIYKQINLVLLAKNFELSPRNNQIPVIDKTKLDNRSSSRLRKLYLSFLSSISIFCFRCLVSILEAIHFLFIKKTHTFQVNDNYDSNTYEGKNNSNSLDQNKDLEDKGSDHFLLSKI